MDEPTSVAAKAALADAYSLWVLSPGSATPEVVRAAAGALVAGHDSPIPAEHGPWAAARVMSRRMLVGALTPRELAAWARDHIGLDGDERTEEQLDDRARLEAQALLAGEATPGLVF